MALLLLLLSLVELFLPSIVSPDAFSCQFFCVISTALFSHCGAWNWLYEKILIDWFEFFPCPGCMIKWLHPVLLHAVCSECLLSCKFPQTITRFQDGVASARLLTHSSHNQITLSGILHLASLRSPPPSPEHRVFAWVLTSPVFRQAATCFNLIKAEPGVWRK